MRNVSFRLVLTACFAILFFAHSDLLGQGGVGGSNDFARSAAPAGSGTSNGVWSDGAWITSSGANSAGPQAGDTIFIGDSTAVSPPAGTPPNFTGTVEVDVDGGGFGGPFTSRTVAEAHLGNVAAGDTGILNLNSGVDLNVTGDININQGSLNLSNGDLSAANIFVNGGTLDVDAGQTVTATTLTFDSAASTGDLDGIVNVTNLNVLGEQTSILMEL